jgi:hypothetical protein
MLRHANLHCARLTQAHRTTSAPLVRPRTYRVAVRIAAPRRAEQPADLNLLNLDNAERARLEQADAFQELVNMSSTTQKVNRPQKVSSDSYQVTMGSCRVHGRMEVLPDIVIFYPMQRQCIVRF